MIELSRLLEEVVAEEEDAFFAGAFLAVEVFLALPVGLPRLPVEPAFFGVVDFLGVVAFFTPAVVFFVVVLALALVVVRFLAMLALAGDLVLADVCALVLLRRWELTGPSAGAMVLEGCRLLLAL